MGLKKSKLKKFDVHLVQYRSCSTSVTVKARDVNEAYDKALEAYRKSPDKFKFEDDGNYAETEVGCIFDGKKEQVL